MAERFKTDHHEHRVRAEAAGIVQKLAWHWDEPFADVSALPTYYLCRCAREHVTVALSGDGADEIFAGYRRYRLDLIERRLRRYLPAAVRRRCRASPGPTRNRDGCHARCEPARHWQNLAIDAPAAFCRSVAVLADDDKAALLAPELAAALGGYRSDEIIRRYMKQSGGSDLDQLLYADFKTYLVDDILTKVDRASMAVSLEVRVPFLDHHIVEFARRLPAAAKIARSQGKAVLKHAMHGRLDRQTIYRAKQGFIPPIGQWLQGEAAQHVARHSGLAVGGVARLPAGGGGGEASGRPRFRLARQFAPALVGADVRAVGGELSAGGREAGGVKVMSFSSCFPSAVDPLRGVFVRDRLAALAKLAEVEVVHSCAMVPALRRAPADRPAGDGNG